MAASMKTCVSCPVCQKEFPVNSINLHIDKCLGDQDSSNKQVDEVKRTKRSYAIFGGKKDTCKSVENKPKQSKEITKKVFIGKTQSSPPDIQESKRRKVLTGQITSETNSKIKATETPIIELSLSKPLAEIMRPLNLDDYIGQDDAVGEGKLLRSLVEANEIPSMIFWGPPGCGKTTLARIIAHHIKNKSKYRFVQLSATTSGIADVKEVIKIAKNEQKLFKKSTILFVDEIHRFNKIQQDTFLPHVEDGTIVLIGATTENPSFHVNNALCSRCRVIVLQKLSADSIQRILKRALGSLHISVLNTESNNNMKSSSRSSDISIEADAVMALANLCDGDARAALNALQTAVQSTKASCKSGEQSGQGDVLVVTKDHINEGFQRSHIQYDKTGDQHYDIISALHKSMRGSDANASLYWLARMLEGGEKPLYIARRLVRFASEDIGLADPLALNQAVATYQACHFIGMPECDVIMAQCVAYLAKAPKSIEVYSAYKNAKTCIRQHKGPLPGVPIHLRNAPTKLMKNLGYGKDYQYNPLIEGEVNQTYLPPGMEDLNFFKIERL